MFLRNIITKIGDGMIYKNLSIAAGGGIIDHSQQAEQEDCANIFIGLGGTGIDCLKAVKCEVYNRLKPDDNNSDEPTYRHIKYLAIDSDRCSINDETFASIDYPYTTEFTDISCKDIFSVIENLDLLSKKPSLRWLSDRITIWNAEAGAGGVRQVGRLLMMGNVSKIVYKIQSLIQQAIVELHSVPIYIHILTGMGGGTGSGIFLDICYLIRHILEQLALAGRACICGYFFLPDVNLERIHNDSIRQCVKANGYAAMKELDYCMNFQQNGGEWSQVYDDFTIKTKKPPVDFAYLISAKDENGVLRANGYMYSINVVADTILDKIIKRLWGPWGFAIPPTPQSKKLHGACYNYSVLGAATAYIPYKDINSYLAARIFEAYETLPRSCHDIDIFVSDNGFTYKSLLNKLNMDVGAIPMYETDVRVLFDQVQGIDHTLVPQLLTQMLHKKPEILGNYARNRESLTQNTIVVLRDKLLAFCVDRSRGPIYSALLLRNYKQTDRDMVAIIQGYITENNKNESQARAILELRESELAKALREFQSSNPFNRRKRCQAYVFAVHAYLSQEIKVHLYDEMGKFIKDFMLQVLSLRDEFFSPLLEKIDNVAETFKANFDTLNKNVVCDNESAIKIVGLDDDSLKASLDEDVEQLDCTSIVLQFVQHLIDNPQKWESRSNDAQISAMVSEFFVNQLNAFTSKSIDSYLQTKFYAPTQAELVNDIYKNVMLELEKKAAPMFWARKTIDQNSKMGYCSFPNTSAAIQGAVNLLNQKEPKIQPITSIMPDRISMRIYYRGVPLYMYYGSFVYKEDYERFKEPGLHIYEGTEQDQRDFRKLRSVIPLSLYIENELENVENFVCDYKRAVQNGVIYKQSTYYPHHYDYLLRLVDDEDFSAKKQRINSMIKAYNELSDKTLWKYREEYEGFIRDDNNTQVKFKDHIVLPNNGAKEYEESVVRDHVFASEYYTSILYEQLAKIDELDSLLFHLQSLLEHIAN